MRKTGAQSATTLTVQDREMEAHRTRQCAVNLALPLQVVELSEGSRGDAGRSTIACVGCAGRSRQAADRFDAIICNNLHK
jgi:hypothetical protein